MMGEQWPVWSAHVQELRCLDLHEINGRLLGLEKGVRREITCHSIRFETQLIGED